MHPSVKYNTEFMKVECEQDWKEMQPIEEGRLCHSCQKPVYDFTGWERSRILEYYKERPATCGMFKAEQLDPSLHPIEFSFTQIRAGHFLIPLLTFIGLPHIKAQDSPPGKAVVELTADTARIKLNEKILKSVDKNTGAAIEKEGKVSVVNPKAVTDTKAKKKAKKFYWSKRFPFIHRKPRFIGGCPRF